MSAIGCHCCWQLRHLPTHRLIDPSIHLPIHVSRCNSYPRANIHTFMRTQAKKGDNGCNSGRVRHNSLFFGMVRLPKALIWGVVVYTYFSEGAYI
ncbi:expressed protein [Echinococcus multilocularis]|uniref:Expressed protein n=1 Tax=Echinococcus multilocularis TaxID=6211 RepID=A0A068Y676_ECHMU|nr:expressed protein [Echinococcus multilocularis]